MLDDKLHFQSVTGNEAAFTYFQPDGRKSGGAYVTALGTVKKLNLLEGRRILTDGTAIPIEDILEIEDGVSAKEKNAN